MLDRKGNKMTAKELNDDGVVLLIGAIFGLYDGYARFDPRCISDNSDPTEVMERRWLLNRQLTQERYL